MRVHNTEQIAALDSCLCHSSFISLKMCRCKTSTTCKVYYFKLHLCVPYPSRSAVILGDNAPPFCSNKINVSGVPCDQLMINRDDHELGTGKLKFVTIERRNITDR